MIEAFHGEILRDEPMARHTSFRIGGPADLLLVPAGADGVVQAVRYARENSLPLTVLGNGTNVLVADAGIRGVTVIIGKSLSALSVDGNVLRAECGAPLMKAAVCAAHAGLSGMEFAEGIPGTVGGAIFMNAGTLLGDVKGCLQDVTAVSAEGEVIVLERDGLNLSYRHSDLARTGHILLEARFRLRRSTPDEVRLAMERLRTRRRASQPHTDRSAGCVFKNPTGQSAGKLLDEAGAKRMVEGGAAVSARHANFVVNRSEASAADVVTLMERMRELVLRHHGILLHPEIEFVGAWNPAPFADGPEGLRGA